VRVPRVNFNEGGRLVTLWIDTAVNLQFRLWVYLGRGLCFEVLKLAGRPWQARLKRRREVAA